MSATVILGLVFALVTSLTAVIAFLMKHRGVVAVIAMTTAAGIISTIVAGVVVFGEPFPGSAGGIVLRVLAFGLVVVAATLTPPAATPDAVER